MQYLFELHHVDFTPQPEKNIFRDINLTLHDATLTLIKGPSGSGKSTLLRLLCRLNEPSRGKIVFKNQDIQEMNPPDLRRRAALLQQTPIVLPGSIRDNLLYPFRLAANAHLPKPNDATLKKHLCEILLDTMSLDDSATTLSVGQKQRLCFLRALLIEPEVFLLDEPTSALDSKSKEIVETMSQRLVLERGLAVLFVTHDTTFSPSLLSPRTVMVENGDAKELS